LTADTTSILGHPEGGPKPTSHEDWIFGYAPRRALLTRLFGPQPQRVQVSDRGLSAAQLAALSDRGRSAVKEDIEAMEALGLIRRERIGKRDRFIPLLDTQLARSVCSVLESIGRPQHR
jgi:hypothetical protein